MVAAPLTVAAELLLLLLDDRAGTIPELPFGALGVSLAGGALMQLALDRRLDSDTQALVLLDPAPTGDALSDEVLMQISLCGEPHPTVWWLELLAQRREEYLAILMDDLVARGVLHEVDHRTLWKSGTRLYPAADGQQAVGVKTRLRMLLASDEMPDPRDGVLIALADVTGILPRILTADELHRAQPRIEQVKPLEEIGRSVTRVAAEVLAAIATALPLI